jgi:hypothetical protein
VIEKLLCTYLVDAVWRFVVWCSHAGWSLLRTTEFISSLAGAFFGAAAAFLLESRRRHREKRENEYEAILRTQAVLLSQGNSLGWVEKQYPEKDCFDNLKTIILGLTRQMIGFEELAFLGRSSDPQLLIELDVANESYDHFRRLIELRNASIEDFFRDPGTEIQELDRDTGRIRAGGSQRLLFNLRQANQAVSKALNHAKEVNETTARRLLLFARTEFPGRKVPYPRQDQAKSKTPRS